MLTRPLFEYLAIIGISTGILLSVLLLSPASLAIGLLLIGAGIVTLYLHYKQTGTTQELFF
ncbi:MAG: hypothetical protein LJE74_04640 [Proteobacteria bacterium]|jgi:hypothetical protein|nr:hypothetical protein [Pseudomonadota bacterium]MCG6935728.1 hypothetical protein [Pseudomonadota bacterium]